MYCPWLFSHYASSAEWLQQKPQSTQDLKYLWFGPLRKLRRPLLYVKVRANSNNAHYYWTRFPLLEKAFQYLQSMSHYNNPRFSSDSRCAKMWYEAFCWKEPLFSFCGRIKFPTFPKVCGWYTAISDTWHIAMNETLSLAPLLFLEWLMGPLHPWDTREWESKEVFRKRLEKYLTLWCLIFLICTVGKW